MKGMKRFAILFMCLMIIVSCMVPTAFAGDTDLNGETVAQTDKEGNGFKDDINQVSAKINKENGNLEIEGITDVGSDKTLSIWDKIFTQYRGVIVGLSGIGAITMIVFFIINFMKLGASSGNPQARTQALVGIIWCGLAAAGLGGVTIFVGFFYNVLKS